jgi:hypothetical protein
MGCCIPNGQQGSGGLSRHPPTAHHGFGGLGIGGGGGFGGGSCDGGGGGGCDAGGGCGGDCTY